MKKSTLTENKAEKTPTGGVLVGKREGQTIIHNKGTLSGYLVGRTHAEGGIKAVNKSTGQPLEMQGGEVVITAPAVSDNTKNEFNGKMMTNREILSQINVKGGGVAFAKDGMEIPKSVKHTGASYNYGGKTMTDHEIIKHITGGHLSKGMTLPQIAKKHKVSLKELQKQVDMGMKAESEHTSSKREQMKIVKDHLYENPKYYSLLKKAGLKHGGRVHRGSLLRDAKSGNTPARDLNNYNDVLDLQADNMVGADSGLFAYGGGVKPYDANMEGDSADMMFVTGGGVKDLVEYVTIASYSDNPYQDDDKIKFYNFIDFKNYIKDVYANDGATNKRQIYLCINNDTSTSKLRIYVSQGKNTNLNFNPFTGTFKDLEKNLQKWSIGNYDMYDWNRWSGVKSSTSTPSQTSVPNSKVLTKDELKDSKIWIGDDLDLRDKVMAKLTQIGLPEDSRYKNSAIKDLYITTFSNDFVIYDYGRANFNSQREKEMFPSDLGINVGATTTSATIDLLGKKIWVHNNPDLSRKVQELGFANGFVNIAGKKIHKTNFDAIYFGLRGTDKYMYVLDSNRMEFDNEDETEIFESDLFGTGTATPTSANTLTEIPDTDSSFSGTIKDLPEPIKKLSLQRQVDAGNTPNDDLLIGNDSRGGNFNWDSTSEGDGFWQSISIGNFEPFKKIYGKYGEGLTGINISATPTSAPIDLSRTKIWIGDNPALSKKIQERAFELGWGDKADGVKNTDRASIFFREDKTIAILNHSYNEFDDYNTFKTITESDLFGTGTATATPTSTIKPIQVTKLTDNDLTNSKIYLGNDPVLCEKIQKRAFQLGLRWVDGDGRVSELDAECLFFDDSTINRMEFGDATKFAKSKFKQIYVVDSMTTSTPTSAPFDFTLTKIWIGDNPSLSEKIQKRAMELGFDWWGGDKTPKNLNFVSLFFDANEKITSTDSKKNFDSFKDYKEITEADIFGNSTSTASQTSKQNMPVEDEDWVKKFTADLDKLATYLPNDIDFAPQLSKEKKDLENLKKLLPSFQQKKYAIERAKILKEIKRLHNKLTYEGFIQGNEEGSTGADLFTPQGLLDYYYTQATQNPTADLDPPCELPTPNGEKSKLPMSAYLNVRTQQFKNWFGDWEKAYETGNYVNCSKMIDPDTKEPKIYFHGVRKYVPNFGQFSNMGQGVVRPYGAFEPTFPASYFAGEEDYAKFYGGIAENLPTPSADYKPFIYKVFLSVKNPISLLPLDFMLSYKDFLDYIYVGYGVKVTPNQELLKVLNNDMIKKNPMWIYIRRDIGVIELLKDYGYDAIFQMGDIPVFLPNGEVEPDRTKHLQEVEYLTFYPNQVKSATVKKSFYFDFFNDIRFKNGGYVRI